MRPRLPGNYPAAFWALTFVSAVGRAGQVVTPFLTLYLTSQQGFSPVVSGLILSLYGVGGTAAVVFSGVIVDAFGAKRMLTLAMLLSALSSVALAFASSLPLICAIVLVYGAAAQAMMPAFNTLVSENSPLLALRNAYSIQHIAGNVGFATLPLAGGILSNVHFSLIFYFEALLVLVSVVVVAIMIPGRSLPQQQEPSASGLQFLRDIVVVFRDGVFLRFLLASVVFVVLFKQTQITMPLVMEEQGHGTGFYGLILTLNGLGVVLLQLPADRITRSFTPSRVVALGALITAFGLGLQALARDPLSYALIAIVWTVGELFHFAISNNIAARLAPPGFRGRYLGVFALAEGAASLLGPAIGGVLFEYLGSVGMWVFCGIAMLGLTLFRWGCRHEIDRRIDAGSN